MLTREDTVEPIEQLRSVLADLEDAFCAIAPPFPAEVSFKVNGELWTLRYAKIDGEYGLRVRVDAAMLPPEKGWAPIADTSIAALVVLPDAIKRLRDVVEDLSVERMAAVKQATADALMLLGTMGLDAVESKQKRIVSGLNAAAEVYRKRASAEATP